MTRRKDTTGTYVAGERGRNWVRLFAHWKSGMLYLEWFGAERKRRREALGHADWAVGKLAADEKAVALGRGKPIGRVSLTALFDRYEEEVTPQKAAMTQRHDRRAFALFRAAWDCSRPADSLNLSDWQAYIRQREKGNLRPKGRKTAGGVRKRVLEQDLRLLLAVLNWATRVGHDGGLLLERNPLKGLPVPREKNPKRDLMRDGDYRKLRDKAAGVHPMFAAFLTVVHETGHRSQSVRLLRWSDIDLAAQTCRWRAETDKTDTEHVTPLSDEAVQALRTWRAHEPRIGDGWVFPSPKFPSKAVRRELVRDWFRQAEEAAELPHVRGRGFHSLRRKFATERRHFAPSDLQHLGGWADYQTIIKCYQQPELEELREAMKAPLKVVG